jgi:hypothetical protein
MNLFILDYNNYYNRTIKKPSNLVSAYQTYISYTLNNTDFNPGDHVDTEKIIGAADYDGFGDYCLVANTSGRIVSRWFIMDAKRERSGQWRLRLHRDVVADYYDYIVNAPCFIEKATVNINDPAIYNSENMTYNQIKTSETIIDGYGDNISWVAAYINRDQAAQVGEIAVPAEDVNYDYSYTNKSEYAYAANDVSNPYYGSFTGLQFSLYTKNSVAFFSAGHKFNWQSNGQFIGFNELGGIVSDGITITNNNTVIDDVIASIKQNAPGKNWTTQAYNYTSAHTETQVENLLKENGKIIYESGTNTYWKVKVEARGNSEPMTATVPTQSSLGQLYKEIALGASDSLNLNQIYGNPYQIEYTATKYVVSLEEVTLKSVAFTMSATRRELEGVPYDVIMFPVGNNLLVKEAEGAEHVCSANLGLKMAAVLGLRDENLVIDVQLLPYSPFSPNAIMVSTYLATGETNTILEPSHNAAYVLGKDYDFLRDSDNSIVGLVFYPSSKDFQQRVKHKIKNRATTALEKKINVECDMMRLCSPNYDGVFEYNQEKTGNSDYFNIYCSLKPFQPFILVAPDFANLYGGNFNDARGLICGGDFSLPRSTDRWLSYVLNNKNYENVFNRQIENMEVNNKYSRIQDIAGMAVGTVQGAATGAVLSGNLAGAAVGAGVSAVGGVADLYINEQLRKEGLDYTRDMFGFQMGNIQALPNVLTKIGAFDINYKNFPFVEYYTCTDVEKEALRNKIKYNGMTVGRIDKISNFIGSSETYIKGQVIRITNLHEDTHLLNAIYNEIN